MTNPDERLSRQDEFLDAVAAFLQRNAFGIALIVPVVFIAVVPIGSASVLVLLVIYLGEAILYAVMRRGDGAGRGVHSGPSRGCRPSPAFWRRSSSSEASSDSGCQASPCRSSRSSRSRWESAPSPGCGVRDLPEPRRRHHGPRESDNPDHRSDRWLHGL